METEHDPEDAADVEPVPRSPSLWPWLAAWGVVAASLRWLDAVRERAEAPLVWGERWLEAALEHPERSATALLLLLWGALPRPDRDRTSRV